MESFRWGSLWTPRDGEGLKGLATSGAVESMIRSCMGDLTLGLAAAHVDAVEGLGGERASNGASVRETVGARNQT